MNHILIVVACILTIPIANAQYILKGALTDEQNGDPLAGAKVLVLPDSVGSITNASGIFELQVKTSPCTIVFTLESYQTLTLSQHSFSGKTAFLHLQLKPANTEVNEVSITSQASLDADLYGISRLKAIDGFGLYEGKKTEVLEIGKMNFNQATNNSRQAFAKVPGINIIENDGAGIQLGIGVRGLNPNRITEFNARQNGYDISADALGYPESYYTPQMQGVERIEVVRGAASLQYGPQFGGLLNFVMKSGPTHKKIEVLSHQTVGSFGLFNSFNSIGGQVNDFNYYGFVNYKRGDGWRKNTGFEILSAFTRLQKKIGQRLSISAEFTWMHYTMQQPGGLTDKQFAQDPRQSLRDRNWFLANWMIPSATIEYRISEHTKLNLRTFALIANRSSIGNLTPPNQIDYQINRTLLVDDYQNLGAEVRLIHDYSILKKTSAFLAGARVYKGNTRRRQGMGSSGKNPDFQYINPDNLEGSDYKFPSWNIAAFIENILYITPKLTITPGIRWEFIQTQAIGYYKTELQKNEENKIKPRNFPLLGLGLSWHTGEHHNLYANFSQAYNGVNFNDIRVINPNFKVDPNLKDMTGYNFDFGFRGRIKKYVNFDVGGFLLAYNDRIGVLTMADANFNVYRYRTNIANARSIGTEAYIEINLLECFQVSSAHQLSIYSSGAWIEAYYLKSPFKSVQGKYVEYAPRFSARSGLQYKYKGIQLTLQHAYTADQFTDATNAILTPTGVNGIIPAYQIMDFTASYKIKKWFFGLSCNNILNQMYFTRRADGYPGPGILPSDGRSFSLSVGFKY